VFIGLRLLEWRELRKMWKVSRFEAFVFVATMLGIVVSDFIDGVLIGVVLSLVYFAHTQRQLGLFGVAADEPEESTSLLGTNDDRPDVGVVRIEGPIFFVSHTGLEALAARAKLPPYVIFDLAGVPLIDVTGLETLRAQIEGMNERGTKVLIARASAAVELRLSRANVQSLLFGERLFSSVDEALHAIGPVQVPRPRPTPPLNPAVVPA
jgi:SulP family sulfate permease